MVYSNSMCTVVKVAQSFRVDHCLHYKLFTTVMAIVSGSERTYTFRALLTELNTILHRDRWFEIPHKILCIQD